MTERSDLQDTHNQIIDRLDQIHQEIGIILELWHPRLTPQAERAQHERHVALRRERRALEHRAAMLKNQIGITVGGSRSNKRGRKTRRR